MTIIQKLADKKLISPPKFMPANMHYLTIMGSEAYGVSTGGSDRDLYGFCIPPKDDVFPHLRGEIPGFGKPSERFEQFQQHHIKDADSNIVYDILIYSIVKYFQLCMENNPNIIDSIYTPQRCILHITSIGRIVRDNRDLFLHKGSWHKFKGYAYSQIHKMRSKDAPKGKRRELVDAYGYDVKFAYHIVRLLNEVEQILLEGTIDLERNREQLKSIRRGEWQFEEILDHFQRKEAELETLYLNCKLPNEPDEDKIKRLLLHCLEEHYGSLSNAEVVLPGVEKQALDEIAEIIERVRRKSL